MKVYTCNDHIGHYSIGTSTVIVAIDEAQAVTLLRAELLKCGLTLDDSDFTLVELDTTTAHGIVLMDGDY